MKLSEKHAIENKIFLSILRIEGCEWGSLPLNFPADEESEFSNIMKRMNLNMTSI